MLFVGLQALLAPANIVLKHYTVVQYMALKYVELVYNLSQVYWTTHL